MAAVQGVPLVKAAMEGYTPGIYVRELTPIAGTEGAYACEMYQTQHEARDDDDARENDMKGDYTRSYIKKYLGDSDGDHGSAEKA